MTSYNYENYISKAIESVLDQTFTDLELIVLDDSSVDASRDIIRNYASQDSRVKYVFHHANRGIGNTINEGIETAAGKFIAFLDSDDLWARDKLEKQLAILEKDEDLVVWTDGEIINRDNRPVGLRFTGLHRATEKKKTGAIFDEIVKGNFILFSSLMFKKDNLKGLRFNTGIRYFGDFTFSLDLAANYNFHFIDECLTKYRIHGNNITLKNRKAGNTELIKIYEYILDRYRARLDRKLLSRLMCFSSVLYSREERYQDSLSCLYYGIKMNPLNAYYLLLLPVSLMKYFLWNRFAGRWDPFRRLANAG
jgi:glycosyltransferase involved in cell wall biosynthesis